MNGGLDYVGIRRWIQKGRLPKQEKGELGLGFAQRQRTRNECDCLGRM